MSALPRAEFTIRTGQFIRTKRGAFRSADIWRLSDHYDVEFYAVVIDGHVVREFDTEGQATTWIVRNI